MAHAVKRLISTRINNIPLLIRDKELKSILEYLKAREEYEFDFDEDQQENERNVVIAENTAVIDIMGNLVYRDSPINALCGLTSYEVLVEDVKEVIRLGVKTIVFNIDSGGGEAYGCFETAALIRKIADDNDVELITYVDGLSASAAYALACISDEVIANPMAEVGSIGVLVRLIDDSKYKDELGVKDIYITSVEDKVPFDEDGGFKETFIKDLQDKVNSLHNEFASFVSGNRNISIEKINSLKGKTFMAKDAISIGLVDKVMTHIEFSNYLSDKEDEKNKKRDNNMSLFSSMLNKDKQEKEMIVDENLQISYEKLQAEFEEYSLQKEELIEGLEARIAEQEAQLKEYKEKLTQIEQETKANMLKQRQERLAAVVGDEKAKALMEHFGEVDDAAFDVLVSAQEAALKEVEKSEMFNEVGVSGSNCEMVDVPASVRYLKEKAKGKK